MKLLLIDAYAMIYRAYYAFIQAPRLTSKGENTSAIYGFVVTLEDLLKRLQPTHVGVAFDPKGKTFRHEAFDQYKAQRPETPEDIRKAVPIIKDILAAMRIPVLEVEGFEADDVIGTMAKLAEKEGFEVYMATPDKDYGQLVSMHIHMYRPRHSGGFEDLGPKEIREKYGLESVTQVIDLLGLMGDASDNIPGCVGVGEKTAVKLLNEFGSIENLLENTERLKGAIKTKIESQVEQIRFSQFLATIRTDVPIEFNAALLVRQEADKEKLVPLYQQLEFRSFLKSMGEKMTPEKAVAKSKAKAKVDDGQLSLFADEMEPMDEVSADEVTEVFAPSSTSDTMKEDYKRMIREGMPLPEEPFDTQVAHYLLQSEGTHDTDYLTEVLLHRQYTKETRETALTLLREYLSKELKKTPKLWRLFVDVEMPLVEVLASMELAGVRFDAEQLSHASAVLRDELNQIEQEIYQLAETIFNINSPKQVGEILFDKLRIDTKAKKTKGGQYITSEDVLLNLKDRHPVVSKILDYRALGKLLGTYIDALPALINPETGKIHTTYNQTIAATGRLSSSNPNLQNLPIRSERGKEIRKAVIPDEGCVFMAADYSQIELRLMAHFSSDPHLIEAFKNGQDIHAATAAKIFHCPMDQVTKDMRRKAKTANFGILYGISAFGLAQQLECSRTEAKQLIDDYFASFYGINMWIEQAKEAARLKGYVETLYGRKRFLPDIHSHNATVRAFAERNAVNAPIQGTAADIIKIAMVDIYREMKKRGLKAQMIMQVHDELCFNVPLSEVDEVRRLVVDKMEHAVRLQVPLVADCNVGANWLEAH